MNQEQLMALVGIGLIIYLVVLGVRAYGPRTGKKRKEGAPPQDELPLEGTKLVKVFETTHSTEAHLVRTFLENAGIPCKIFDEGSTWYNIYDVGATVKVMVAGERLTEAKTVIEEYLHKTKETP